MAEIRKHEPDAGDGLGALVRQALGETIRPTQPGGQPEAEDVKPQPSAPETAASLPTWQGGDGITWQFEAD